MAEIRPPFRHDLDTLVKKTYLNGIFATGDALANCFAVELYKGNAPYTIPSGATVKGYFVRKGTDTIELPGTKSGNVASVTLNSACYNQNGPFTLTIKVLEGSAVTTVFYGEGSMAVSRTGYTVNPSFEAVEYYKYPVNLLDNSWFGGRYVDGVKEGLVYQAGLNGKHGSNKCPFDRWISWEADVTIADGYITPGSPIDQRIDLNKIDTAKTYTVAICLADGTIKCESGTPAAAFGSYGIGIYAPAMSGGVWYVRLNTGLNIRWAALYEGAYTAETMPPYRPKPYTVELAECQRYYVRLNSASEIGFAGYAQNATTARITIPLPNAMRIDTPTLTVTYRSQVNLLPGSIVPTSIDSVKCVGHVAAIVMTCSGLTAGEPLVMKPNATIELSAEL